MPPSLLAVDQVTKSYGTFEALKGVSLRVEPGEFVALVGPSGCGKTTLLKMVAGFETPSSGGIAIDGADMTGVPPQARPTRMVFQKLALFPHMTVAENIGFPLKLQKLSARDIAAKVDQMITLMQLKPEYLSRFPRALSGGEQQRVALARSMVSDPKLLLLDEPLSALDVKLKKVLQAELKRLHRSLGVTFLHVTHDLEEAMMLADRIAVMRAGKVLQLGRPDDIYYRPADAFVAGFIGDTNLFPVTVTRRDATSLGIISAEVTSTSVPVNRAAADIAYGPALLMVRPELIEVATPGKAYAGTLAASVEEMFLKGSAIQYRARSAAGRDVVFEVTGSSRPPAAVGDQVTLGFAADDIYLFAPTGDQSDVR